MIIVFLILLLGVFTQSLCMQNEGVLSVSKVASTSDKTCAEELYKMLGYKKTRNFIPLPVIRKCIENLPDEAPKKWLTTSQGCAFLLETLGQECYKRLPKVVGFIMVGYYLRSPEIREWIKVYLEENPLEKKEIEEEYFHYLLCSCTINHIKYYQELGLSLASHDADGCTWLMAAVIENLPEVVQYFIDNKKELGINIHATDSEGMNAFVHALLRTNPIIVKALMQNDVYIPEAHKGVLAYLELCIPRAEINTEKLIKKEEKRNGFH